MVIWLIGLSGSGKTTLGTELVRQWRVSEPNTILVDGDQVRRIFGQDQQAADYTVAARRVNAERIVELCGWLDAQAQNVVCSVLSIFPDLRARARERFSGYFEVFLNPPMQALCARERDSKGLYRRALSGELKHVVGVDIPFPPPTDADLELDTSHSADVPALARRVLAGARARGYAYSQGDRLEDRNTYFYSEYRGPAFLDAWRASRDAALASLPAPQCLQPSAAQSCTDGDADGYRTAALLGADVEPELLDRLLQRFEVSKRLYRRYDADFRALRDSGYDDLGLYLLFGAACLGCQPRPAAMRYASALLKVVDSLISVRERLSPEQGGQLAWLILEERAWLQRTAASVDVELRP